MHQPQRLCTIGLPANKRVCVECIRHTSLVPAAAPQPQSHVWAKKHCPCLSTVLPRAAFPLAPEQSHRPARNTSLRCVCASTMFSSVIYFHRLRHLSQIATQFSSALMAVWRMIHVLSPEKLSQHVCNKDLVYPLHNKAYLQDSYFNTNMPYIEIHYRELNLGPTTASRENSGFL